MNLGTGDLYLMTSKFLMVVRDLSMFVYRKHMHTVNTRGLKGR